MQRGIPDITIYTFEVAEGREMPYPDAELWTLDYAEADALAEEKGYLLMGQDWGEDEPGLVHDYTPRPVCVICGVSVEKTGDGYGHLEDYGDLFEVHNPVLSAVLVTREKP